MAQIVTPAIRKLYKSLLKQTVKDLGKPVIVFSPPDEADCPNCFYDFINKKSSGKQDTSFVTPIIIFGNLISPITFTRSRCPVCFGAGRLLSTDNSISITALVKWNPQSQEDLQILPVGREGIDFVRIKALRSKLDLIKTAIYFEVDGVRCEIIKSPTIRALGTQEELVVVFLEAVEVGKDTKK